MATVFRWPDGRMFVLEPFIPEYLGLALTRAAAGTRAETGESCSLNREQGFKVLCAIAEWLDLCIDAPVDDGRRIAPWVVEAAEAARDHLVGEIRRLERRQQEHLGTIRRISIESITPDEADELRRQIGGLMAEVGTLRAELGEAQGERDDARGKHSALLEVYRRVCADHGYDADVVDEQLEREGAL